MRGLVGEAVRHDCALEVACSVGDFVPLGTPVINIHAVGTRARRVAGRIDRAGTGAFHRGRSGVRPAHHGRHRHPGALAGGQRSHHGRCSSSTRSRHSCVVWCPIWTRRAHGRHRSRAARSGWSFRSAPLRTICGSPSPRSGSTAATSTQVCRRLRSMLEAMIDIVGPACRADGRGGTGRLDRTDRDQLRRPRGPGLRRAPRSAGHRRAAWPLRHTRRSGHSQ